MYTIHLYEEINGKPVEINNPEYQPQELRCGVIGWTLSSKSHVDGWFILYSSSVDIVVHVNKFDEPITYVGNSIKPSQAPIGVHTQFGIHIATSPELVPELEKIFQYLGNHWLSLYLS